MNESNGAKIANAIELVEQFLIKRSTRHAYIVKSWMQANVTVANWHDLEIKLHEEGFSPHTVDELHEEMLKKYTRGDIYGEWLKLLATASTEQPAEPTVVQPKKALIDFLSVGIFILAMILTAFGLTVLVNPTEKRFVIFNMILLFLITIGLWTWIATKSIKYYFIRRGLKHYSPKVWAPRYKRLWIATAALVLVAASAATIGYYNRRIIVRDTKQTWARLRGIPPRPANVYLPPPKPSEPEKPKLQTPPTPDLAQELHKKDEVLEQKDQSLAKKNSEIVQLRNKLAAQEKRTTNTVIIQSSHEPTRNTTVPTKHERRDPSPNNVRPNKVEISVLVSEKKRAALQKKWTDRLEKNPR